MAKAKKYFLVLLSLFILTIFLIGFQQKAEKTAEQKPIGVVNETASEETENFDDNLDEALNELEEVEGI